MSPPIGATRRFELPNTLDFGQMTALSMEVRQKLESIRPRTIGQAGRIDGMTPAALTLIAAHIKRGNSKRAKSARVRVLRSARYDDIGGHASWTNGPRTIFRPPSRRTARE